jgi:hypothetical protein
MAWVRYGRPRRSTSAPGSLLDELMPDYDVVERHRIRVRAAPETTLAAAQAIELLHLPLVRCLVRAREVILGAVPDATSRPRGLRAEAVALGWVVLAEVPGREVVFGSVTKPWEANVTFRSVPPDRFRGFAEPGYVKIVWTLRSAPNGAQGSIFETETRAGATDPLARRRFRRYWSLVSPGIIIIRWAALRPIKLEAERRARAEVPGEAAPAGGSFTGPQG